MIIGISGKKQHGKDTVAKIIQYLIFQSQCVPGVNWSYEDLCKHLLLQYPQNMMTGWETKKFSDKLKQIVCILIGCTMEQLEDNTFKETPLGEEWRVWYWQHYKLSATNGGRISQLYTTKEEAEAVVITDSRGNEMTVVQAFGVASQLVTQVLTPRLLLQYIGTECGRNIIHPNIWVNALMSEYRGEYVGSGKSLELSKELQQNWIISDVRFPNEVEAIKKRGGMVIRVNRPEVTSNDTHHSETALDDYDGFDYVIRNGIDGIDSLIEPVKLILKEQKII